MPKSSKRPMEAQDLYRISLITDCSISPDGRHVVFSQQRVDRKTEKKFTNLWIVPTAGGPARQFTHGKQEDTHPRWSPDGEQIAFLSNRGDNKQSQIFIIPYQGGEACPLTSMKGKFEGFKWSPDGKQLVFKFRKKDTDAQARDEDEQKKEKGVVARHITRLFYKLDDDGYLPQERWHIWTVEVPSGRVHQLTEGDVYDEWDPHWSPDGEQIVFCSNRTPDPDQDPDAIDLYLVPAAGGEIRRVPTPLGLKRLPNFSPDGRWIAYIGAEGRKDWWKNERLWVVPVDAADGKDARCITQEYDLHLDSYTINDMGHPIQMPPVWSEGGQRLYFQVVQNGSTLLQSISLAGDDLQLITGERGVVGSFSFDRHQDRMAYFYGQIQNPGQVWVQDLQTGQTDQLTHVNQELFQELDLGEVEEVWFKGSSGNDLQGWILKPPGFDPVRKYPSILEIHGGPMLQYGFYFMHEFYYLAAQGYVVYFCNPRGGRGYGEDHTRAIWNDWGSVDYEDLMAWTDYVSQLPYIDTQRMGVTGGSYGGYMTNWIIGHTTRFGAAVTQRSVSNLISIWGSSDFNWYFQEVFGDVPPWEAVEHYWRMSPMKYVGAAKTPTLVIHSEQDLRCAVEQGEQMFVALRRLGVDSEMVLFPDEPHGLSRKGRTDRRIERLRHIRRWFDRYLIE